MWKRLFLLGALVNSSVSTGIHHPVCPINEVYSECGNNGCQNTCANRNISIVCRPICTSGCICREGYLRNSQGVCVVPSRCDNCGPNEVFKPCGDICPVTCANKDNGPLICPQICLINGGCGCKPGYVRGWNNACIKPEKCPTCHGPNEFYSCGSACDTTCATLGENCPIINIQCNEMCYCKAGFARDSRNICIPIRQCPPKPCRNDTNALSLPCGDPCPRTCDNKDDPLPRPCPLICLVAGCKCKPGYVLNRPGGKCILQSECPPKQCPNDPNAIVVPCGDSCPATCDNKDDPQPRPCTKICLINGCKCKPGYVLDKPGGKCILAGQCPPRQCPNDTNATVVPCGDPCPVTCDNKDDPIPRPCPAICLVNGCKCKPGYVLNRPGGKCILPGQCPPKQCPNDPNAIVVPCGDSCPATCDNKDDPQPRPCPAICIVNGCKCKPGYVLNRPGGKCILAGQCPPKQCPNDTNAIIVPCGDPCPATCDNKDDPQPRPCPTICLVNGCKCKPGYVLNRPGGKCILASQCPPKQCPNDTNAIVLPCGDPCPTTCNNINDPLPRPCPAICIVNGCKCKPGYVLHPSCGKCVLASECHSNQCPNDPNAVMVPCGDPCPLTCQNRNDTTPRPCIEICIVNGCKCKPGYILNRPRGQCIPANTCPPCGRNEVLVDCLSHNPPDKTCSNYISGVVLDPLGGVCKKGCLCKPGYVRNNKNECVKPTKCCRDPNSELVSCPNPCPGGTCQSPSFAPCRRLCVVSGCQCKNGYLKVSDTNSTCVPASSCNHHGHY